MKIEVIESGIDGLLSNSHRYITDKGIVSLLHPCMATFQSFEIYSIEGELFNDIERYSTLQEVEDRIKQLLQ